MEKTTPEVYKLPVGEGALDIYASKPGLAYWLTKGFSWRPVISFLVLAAVWQFASLFSPPYLIPGIHLIVASLVKVIIVPELLYQAMVTWSRIVGAIFASMVLGVCIGVLMGLFKGIDEFVRPIVKLVMGVPALNWVIIVIIWFNATEVRIGFVMLASCVPIYIFNVYDGIRAIDQKMHDMVETFGANTWHKIRILIWPYVKANTFTATKISIGMAVRIVLIAELVGATSGIGKELDFAKNIFDMPLILAWTLWMVLMLQIMAAITEALEMKVLKWRVEEAKPVS